MSSNANFRNAKVLLVEDNDDHWLLIQQAMRHHLGEVTLQRVATTQQALRLFQDWQWQEWELPKLILVDLYLANNTPSWPLLQQLKAMSGPMRRIPIVMFTASTSAADVEAAYERGVSAYLFKPLDSAGWLGCFSELRTYWWDTATLPPVQYGF